MSDSALYNVILAPHVSEKSTMLADTASQVVFKVAIDATKSTIAVVCHNRIVGSLSSFLAIHIVVPYTTIIKGHARIAKGLTTAWKMLAEAFGSI